MLILQYLLARCRELVNSRHLVAAYPKAGSKAMCFALPFRKPPKAILFRTYSGVGEIAAEEINH